MLAGDTLARRSIVPVELNKTDYVCTILSFFLIVVFVLFLYFKSVKIKLM